MGFVIGGGAQIRVPVVRISPEILYTRWSNENFSSADRDLASSRNQLEILVGVTFLAPVPSDAQKSISTAECTVQVESRADERQMSECLRKVSQGLTTGSGLFSE